MQILFLLPLVAFASACDFGNDCCQLGGICIDPVFDDCRINEVSGNLDYRTDCSPSYLTCCLPRESPTTVDQDTATTTTTRFTTVSTATRPIIQVPQTGCGMLSSGRIVGGNEANPHNWPWQVSLKMDYGIIAQEHYCGGTLVNNQWVVTAAHCLKTIDYEDFRVILGAHNKPGWDVGATEVVKNIAVAIQHPGYTGRAGSPDDLALLKLSEPVEFNQYIQPACLPDSNSPQFVYDDSPECWISGWGGTKGTGNDEILNELQVTVVPQDYCRSQWSANPSVLIGPGQICINNGLTGACNGDSGGPLVCQKDDRWVLAGATSFGVKGCETEGAPDVYTRISYYLPWILDQMELI